MLLRRNIALALGALVLAAPVLSSCGFDYATDRINTVAAGVNNRDKTVDVLGAVVVAAQPNSGTFIATLSNNSQTKSASLTSIAGANGNTVTADDFAPIEVAPGGMVNLALDGGVRLNGTFEAGQFLPVSLTFASGETVVMEIPVVTACDKYAGLDNAPTPSPTDASASASPTSSATPYTCNADVSQADQ
jgi:hypothetical protein